MKITPRVLETYLGSVVKRFDPNEAAKTVWGEAFAQGEELTESCIGFAGADLLIGTTWKDDRRRSLDGGAGRFGRQNQKPIRRL